jgi:hypothetical protein
MEKLLEMLGIQKLDEKEQEAIKDKVQTLIDIKAKELSGVKLQEEKDALVNVYEAKFEEYKEDITGKFSNFVDEILENELVIPEKILEYARKGELYSDLIEQFKVRLGIDEGLLDDEVKSLLKEAKEEIVSLRNKLDDTIADTLETKSDAQELAAELYVRRKADGLTEDQKKHIFDILEGTKDRAEIDKKFALIVESFSAVKEVKEEEGKGEIEVKDIIKEEKVINEDVSPFAQHLKTYVKVLQENRI